MSPQEKATLSKLHEKYYGKGSKAKKEQDKVVKAVKGRKETDRETALRICPEIKAPVVVNKEPLALTGTSSRKDLMQACKEKGIKNYRVMNKAELKDILSHLTDTKYCDEVMRGAVERWKAGFGKDKKTLDKTVV